MAEPEYSEYDSLRNRFGEWRVYAEVIKNATNLLESIEEVNAIDEDNVTLRDRNFIRNQYNIIHCADKGSVSPPQSILSELSEYVKREREIHGVLPGSDHIPYATELYNNLKSSFEKLERLALAKPASA